MSEPVIVFGAGLGGMSAAVALAQRGVKVLLIEKEPRLGGYAISYNRRGYAFDLALHVVPAGGPGQQFHRLITELGLDKTVSFLRLKESFRVHLGEYSFQMPNDYDSLFDSLEREFPREKHNLLAFRKDMEKRLRVYAPIFDDSVSKWISVPPFLLRIPVFLKHSHMPVRKYFERFFRDERLMAILFQGSLFMGIPMDEFPTINFMMMFHVLFRTGMYTISGGGQAITDALINRLDELGVDVVTNAEVSKVLIENGTAVGVRTNDGVEHRASGVIAGGNIPQLAGELIDSSHLPDSYLRKVKSADVSLSVLALNLGLDCHPNELGIDGHIAIAFPDENIDRWVKQQRDSCTINAFSVTAHANTEPAIAPPELSTVSIIAGTNGEKWISLSDEDYRRTSQEVIEDIIIKAGKFYPRLPEHIIIKDLATPRTMKRYTNCPSGAIMGFNCSCGRHRRIMEIGNIPIKRLYPAGAWTKRLGGFMESMKAGACAAQKLSRVLER